MHRYPLIRNAFNNTTLTALLKTTWYAIMLPKFCCFVAINMILGLRYFLSLNLYFYIHSYIGTYVCSYFVHSFPNGIW